MSDVTAAADAGAGASQSESPSLATGASAVEAPVRQKIKTKVDGIEQEIDLDELTKDYQKYKSSDKRFQEAAQMRKEAQDLQSQVDSFLSRAQKGDLSWLKGLVPKEALNQFSESQLLEHLEWQNLPEAEKRARIAEQRAQELEEERRAEREEIEMRQRSEIEQKAYQSVEQDIVDAIKSRGYDTKVTPRLVRRIAEYMFAKIEASEDPQAERPSAKAVSEHALKSMMDDAQEVLSVLPREQILKLIPPKVRDLIRRADVDDAISQMPYSVRKSDGENRPKTKLKRMSTEDYFKKMDKKFN
jgi:hypothetical protein